jgi:hypothetical protein
VVAVASVKNLPRQNSQRYGSRRGKTLLGYKVETMAEAKTPGTIDVKYKKRFARETDDESRVRPAYANQFVFNRFGTEIFLDVCVVPIDDIIGASQTGSGAELDVIVLDRYVFSLDAFLILRAQAEQLYQQLVKQEVITENATPGTVRIK